MRLLLAAALALAGAASALAADTDGAVTRWKGGPWTVWRIDRPAVDRPLIEYADIRLRAGDLLTLDAGGCVSDTLIWLPGAPSPTPLAGALRKKITVPESAGTGSQALRLGRAGSGGACAGQRDAYIFVAVKRVEAESSPAPMDLVWGDSTDENGVALNPKWGLQVTEGSIPDPVDCFDVPGWFDNPLCSTQHPGIDQPVGLRRLICSIGSTTPISGHVNWYPGTFEGPIHWDSLSFVDRDCNVRLVPAEQNALTVNNPENIKGEFDSRETLNHFATPWWASFRKASSRVKKEMISGKPSIISGFVGVDCQHDCQSELHPVWVLAIHVQDDPQDDVWAVFMRNWGNEGFCSHAQHEVNWPRDRFTLTLPWRAGATSVELADGTEFLANRRGVSGWWRDVPDEKVNLTFALPPPSARARVHGELHLRWSGSTLQRAADGGSSGARLDAFEWDEEGRAGEALLEDLAARLSPEKREALERQLAEVPARRDRVHVLLQHGSPDVEETGTSARPSVTSRPDRVSIAENERRLRALLDAFGGQVPGPIGEALRRQEPKP